MRCPSPVTRRAAFTLVELLVVIAVIAVLIGLLLPAVQKVREAAARMKCQNNLKQIGLALHNYHDTNGAFPYGCSAPADPTLIFSVTTWHLQLLPYLEQQPLWDQCLAWYQANPGRAAALDSSFPAHGPVVPTFVCPSNRRPTTGTFFGVTSSLTSYQGCAGTSSSPASGDGVLYAGSGVRLTDVTDGTSNTAAVGERPASGNLVAGWAFLPLLPDGTLGSRDAASAVSYQDLSSNVGLRPQRAPGDTGFLDAAHFWSFHAGGANFVYADGSVHFLPYSADDILPALFTRAGGEVFVQP